MALMEQVICTVCYYFLHILKSKIVAYYLMKYLLVYPIKLDSGDNLSVVVYELLINYDSRSEKLCVPFLASDFS